ncbi:hypothetical protein DFR28_101379 [Arenicella xantha]|uniref:Uncharacterized protein n=1 Tax=Arenicella xantha TaxID=644221 RepID=A0A395JR09_9GAMM|nr:hypothetical protein DFR28_101379 [Arenicella xantha]
MVLNQRLEGEVVLRWCARFLLSQGVFINFSILLVSPPHCVFICFTILRDVRKPRGARCQVEFDIPPPQSQTKIKQLITCIYMG